MRSEESAFGVLFKESAMLELWKKTEVPTALDDCAGYVAKAIFL